MVWICFWNSYKDDVELEEDERIYIGHHGDLTELTIRNVTDEDTGTWIWRQLQYRLFRLFLKRRKNFNIFVNENFRHLPLCSEK